MSLKSFIAKIGLFFAAIFDAAARTWANVSPEVQDALKQGSAILDIINKNVKEAPDFVIELIQKAFPNIDRPTLLVGLKGVTEGLNIADGIVDNDLQATVGRLQEYLSGLKSERAGFWAGISSLAAKLLAFGFAPAGTKWATFEALMEFVYQRFIKK
ncbi:hypothetical protein [Parapedobacter indicus]|uniref:Uncharacterized protein n=2 Tax=Parapedobacter indicus TaxID=1477437 RepID=A0A1I3VSP7_9SPHI|nr:hypothetical protein [Parapedobacter indicus]SFJ98139.1 hypothetical protein SAMN05444682_1245 [Parapedobacter indicus]